MSASWSTPGNMAGVAGESGRSTRVLVESMSQDDLDRCMYAARSMRAVRITRRSILFGFTVSYVSRELRLSFCTRSICSMESLIAHVVGVEWPIMDALEIRPATAADIPSLVRLNALVQAQHAAAYPELFSPPSDADARAHFERVLAEMDFRVRVAVRTGACVGYTVARSERRAPNAFRRAYEFLSLNEICVDPSQRRRGVGAALMSDLLAHATASGVGTLVLDTWAFNVEAHRFFERQGFSPQRIVMWRRRSES